MPVPLPFGNYHRTRPGMRLTQRQHSFALDERGDVDYTVVASGYAAALLVGMRNGVVVEDRKDVDSRCWGGCSNSRERGVG